MYVLHDRRFHIFLFFLSTRPVSEAKVISEAEVKRSVGGCVSVPLAKVHDCKTHGVAVYGDLYGEFGRGVVEGCEIVNNGQDGVLLRGGARGDVVSNVVAGNGRFGVELVNCGEGSTVVGNTITVAANGGGKKAGIGFGGLGTEDAVTLSGNTVSS